MNNNVCHFLFNGFTVSWDPELLTKDFSEIEASGSPFADPTGKPHWQKFDTDVLFARNFSTNFLPQCIEVVNNIKKIQSNLIVNEEDVDILKTFKQHTVLPSRLGLIKTLPGKDIKLHVDSTRAICLNIGLKNSNKWETHIFNEQLKNLNNIDVRNIGQYNTQKVTLNDGDGYLFKIENPHTAICLNKEDTYTSRYILTYSL